MSGAFRIALAVAASLLLAAMSGCGGQPTRTAAAPVAAPGSPGAAAASPATTEPAATAASAATPAPEAAAPATPAAEQRVESAATAQSAKKVPAGYRRVTRNGKELYCRSVTTIGTRFAEQMCFTREQIEEIERRTDQAMDDFETARKTCSGSYCTEF